MNQVCIKGIWGQYRNTWRSFE